MYDNYACGCSDDAIRKKTYWYFTASYLILLFLNFFIRLSLFRTNLESFSKLRLIFFFLPRRLSSFVWSGCRLTNSYVRSRRVTDQLTEREERGEELITQTAVPMPPHPLYMPLAPTMVGGVGAEATATALDMVKQTNWLELRNKVLTFLKI